jgi:hypothetical protein
MKPPADSGSLSPRGERARVRGETFRVERFYHLEMMFNCKL